MASYDNDQDGVKNNWPHYHVREVVGKLY